VTAGARLPRRKGFEAIRPTDVSNDRWQAALRGLQAFVAGGWGQKAEAAGWSRDELFRVPELWSQVHLCGAALLIGDNEVTSVTPTEIRTKNASGSSLAFYRRPAIDYALAYHARLKMAGEDSTREEFQLRALEAVINLYRHNNNCTIDTAKRAVLAAIAEAKDRV
jgi:hypothetical protein